MSVGARTLSPMSDQRSGRGNDPPPSKDDLRIIEADRGIVQTKPVDNLGPVNQVTPSAPPPPPPPAPPSSDE